ncbi:MAG TPA: hypothetical protein VFA50_00390 [Stellaceae bacterium]|nr:hypothetical protein [Stellaceae bacterium]
METPAIVAESGSLLMVRHGARFAVIERRNGRLYGLGKDRRDGFPATADGILAAAGTGWSDEATARARFDDAVARGEALAQRLW